MRVLFKPDLIIITAQSDEERASLDEWAVQKAGMVYALFHQDEQTVRLTALGPRADACREPINVTSRSPDPMIRLISNFAHTPFELDGERYESVEGFWQGLKFSDAARRREIAALFGGAAQRAGANAEATETCEFGGQTIRIGTAEHWQLMRRACWAKFSQCEPARTALLATRQRPLVHKTRRDSRTIPGAIMAEIWMQIRTRLPEWQQRQALSAQSSE